MRLIVYGSIHDRGTFVWKDIGSKPQRVVRVLGKVEYQISVRLTRRVPIRVVEAVTLRDTLDVPGRETGSCPGRSSRVQDI